MAFKNGNTKPRNRSTNTRSLSNRITTLQREMNPTIQASGDMTFNSKRYVERKIAVVMTAAESSLDVTPSSLGVPDGAKILSMKVYSIDTRVLILTVPNETGLVVNNGSATAPFGGFTRTMAAPLSRFPMIKVNIPDLLAAPLDASSTAKLFTVATNGSSTPTYRVVYTAKYLA